METIVIKLSPEKLSNPDLELCNVIPVQVEQFSNLKIKSKGYSFLDFQALGLWFESENAKNDYEIIVELFNQVKFLKNDLSNNAEVYICEYETEKISDCHKVY